jgi:hypothetical protein
MLNESEPPITLAELIEMQELELMARGETRDDASRSLRMRLERLRAGKASRTPIAGSPMLSLSSSSYETRIAALEAEVARLRTLLEGGRN